MTIRIVTDSTSDLPADLARELGITVVPAYVHFGDEIYRDRVDISEDDFYKRLLRDPVHPHTEPPSPQDFAGVYKSLSGDAEGIVSIHISSKLSATCNSATRGKELSGTKVPIQVVDSQLVTMGLGLLAVTAASCVRSGTTLAQVVEKVKATIPGIRMLGLLETLKYLAKGGRMGKAQALLGSMLGVKPMLTMKAGELEASGRVTTRGQGFEKLTAFVRGTPDIEDLAVVYSTEIAEAEALIAHIVHGLSGERIRLVRLGPVLGVHGGPGILFVALRTKI